MVAPDVGEPADFFNHSCDPNLGVLGNVVLVALRPVATDEELTFDYAMTDADSYDEFDCACLADDCRGKVTGYDWMIPEVQQRYRGHFSTYLERRIAGLASDEPSGSLLEPRPQRVLLYRARGWARALYNRTGEGQRSRKGTSLSTRGSAGRPRTRSPTMLRCT